MEDPLRLPEIVLGGLLLFAAAYWHQRNVFAPTPVSRLDILHAVVEDGTLAIDRHRTNTCDLAFREGHYYSDKAPGTVTLALPFFAATVRVLAAVGVPLDSPAGWLASSWVTCVATQGMALALGGVALWSWLRRRVEARAAMVTVLVLTLGGMPLYYATALWSHTVVVGLLSVAVWSVDLLGTAPGNRRMGLAGVCVGLALASEYTAGLVAAGLVLHLAVRRGPGLLWFLVGAGVPLLLVPAYSWATIGTPFDLPYSFQARFPEMREGLFAIKWPRLDIAGMLLFSPERGLFFWSPFLLLAVAREAELRGKGWWLCIGLPLLQLVVISGRGWDWQAGPSIGPRYLAPMLPLLALPCAMGVTALPRLAGALGVLSVVLTTVTIAVGSILRAETPSPLTFFLWDLRHMDLNPSLGGLVGMPEWLSLLVFCTMLGAGIAYAVWLAGRDLRNSQSPSAEGPVPVADNPSCCREAPGRGTQAAG